MKKLKSLLTKENFGKLAEFLMLNWMLYCFVVVTVNKPFDIQGYIFLVAVMGIVEIITKRTAKYKK